MNEQEKRTLNEKLARWLYPSPAYRVGTVDLGIGRRFGGITIEALYTQEDKDYINDKEAGLGDIKEVGKYHYWLRLPIFTGSLDACFEWLVPKLTMYDLCSYNEDDKHTAWACLRNAEDEQVWKTTQHKSISLALCLAIEKLIDTEAK